MITIAALFIDPSGPYPKMANVDCWDIERDARKYVGPHAVVTHPPCQLWINFAALNYARYGGDHNKPGNDAGCFASALASVKRYGGVLEHPADSKAFSAYSLTRPNTGSGWLRHSSTEWVCEVWQSAYVHAARKRTWLYYHGDKEPIDPLWDRFPGHAQIGWFDRNKPTLSKKEASRTPIAFAEYLVALARHAVS